MPQHLVKAIQSLYIGTRMKVKAKSFKCKLISIIIIQEYFHYHLFCLTYYTDDMIGKCQRHINDMLVNTLLFANDQVIFASEDYFQRTIQLLLVIVSKYNFAVSILKKKFCEFIGEEPRMSKIIVNDMPFEQVNFFVIWDVISHFDSRPI